MKKSILIGLILLTSCTSKLQKEQVQEKMPVVLTERNLTLTPASITDQNAAELFDLGIAPANGSSKTILNILNSTSSVLNIDINGLIAKFNAAGKRWSVGSTNTCTGVLTVNGSCRVQIVLNNNATTALEDYTQPVEANLITSAAPLKTIPVVTCNTGFVKAGSTCVPSNPQFGKMIFTGQKAADVAINSVPMLGSIRFSTLADSIILSSGSKTKRFYMGNPLQTGNTIPVPTVIAPPNGIISKNTCTSLTGLPPLKACFFEVTYNYDVSLPSLNESITFGTPAPFNGVSLDTTGVAIALAITNQPPVAPVQAASFAQVSKITDLSSSTQQQRIYVTNTGSGVSDLTTISIPSPFIIAKTSCSTSQSVGSTCFIDLKVDTTKTANITGVAPSISYGSSVAPVSAGQPVTPGQTGSCKLGFSFVNNSCVPSNIEPIYFTLLPSAIWNPLTDNSNALNSNGTISSKWNTILNGRLVSNQTREGIILLNDGSAYSPKGDLCASLLVGEHLDYNGYHLNNGNMLTNMGVLSQDCKTRILTHTINDVNSYYNGGIQHYDPITNKYLFSIINKQIPNSHFISSFIRGNDGSELVLSNPINIWDDVSGQIPWINLFDNGSDNLIIIIQNYWTNNSQLYNVNIMTGIVTQLTDLLPYTISLKYNHNYLNNALVYLNNTNELLQISNGQKINAATLFESNVNKPIGSSVGVSEYQFPFDIFNGAFIFESSDPASKILKIMENGSVDLTFNHSINGINVYQNTKMVVISSIVNQSTKTEIFSHDGISKGIIPNFENRCIDYKLADEIENTTYPISLNNGEMYFKCEFFNTVSNITRTILIGKIDPQSFQFIKMNLPNVHNISSALVQIGDSTLLMMDFTHGIIDVIKNNSVVKSFSLPADSNHSLDYSIANKKIIYVSSYDFAIGRNSVIKIINTDNLLDLNLATPNLIDSGLTSGENSLLMWGSDLNYSMWTVKEVIDINSMTLNSKFASIKNSGDTFQVRHFVGGTSHLVSLLANGQSSIIYNSDLSIGLKINSNISNTLNQYHFMVSEYDNVLFPDFQTGINMNFSDN